MKIWYALTLVIALALLGGAAGAWDVSGDFSTVYNPNGQWAYGGWWSGQFHAGASVSDLRGYTGLDGWGNPDDPVQGYYTPYVVQNTTRSLSEYCKGGLC